MNNVYKIACSNIPLYSISRWGEYHVDEGSWKANVIKFNDDGTGYVTFTDLITYEKVSAEFNWQFAEYYG